MLLGRFGAMLLGNLWTCKGKSRTSEGIFGTDKSIVRVGQDF